MAILLEQLDQKTVAVELDIGGELRVLRGAGNFVHEPPLGDCLRIVSGDPDDPFEILLRKSEWAGTIAVDERHGCDYRIRLNSVCQLQ